MSAFFGLDTEAYDRQYADRDLMRRLARYFAPQRLRVLAVGLLITSVAVAGAAQPLLVSRGLDLLVTDPTLTVVWVLVAMVLLIGILNWAANWVRRRLTARVIGDVVLALRRDAFESSVNHDM